MRPNLKVKLQLNDRPCNMEVDTGSSYSVILYNACMSLWKSSGPIIKKITNLPLMDFQGNNSVEGLL